jgi:anti-anti-sigma factor
MEIEKEQKGEALEFKVTGRLDAYWSDHLSAEITSAIRNGAHQIRLDLSGVQYISSAGIRVLLNFYQQLKAIQGLLIVSECSDQAKSVLQMAGLFDLLSPTEAATGAFQRPGKKIERENAIYEVFPLQATASMTCKMLGDPSLLEGCRFNETHVKKLPLSKFAFSLGLGAFGDTFADCSGRFGEYLAVSGAAAHAPTDTTGVPDYLVSTGKFIPEMILLYGLVCEGNWRNLIRFDSKKEQEAVKLSEIIAFAHDLIRQDTFAMALVCESAGLVGASLTKSPAHAVAGAPFDFPQTVDWFSFTAERAHAKSVTLIAGIIDYSHQNNSMLRSMDQNETATWHFHAIAFPYKPLKKGKVEIADTVHGLFDSNLIEGVLHLIVDDREIGGVGQSEFVRGACWISPVSKFIHEN